MRRNPFIPLSSKEQADKEQIKKDIGNRIETVSRLASECLDDPKFKRYKEEFDAMRKNVFESLHQPIDPDPIKDAYYLRACMNTILILEKILTSPEKDIRR